MRSFVDAAMVLQTKEELDYTTASMAKYWVSEKAHMNISKLLQLFGGWGYMWEYPIARAYADSRAGFFIIKFYKDKFFKNRNFPRVHLI